MKSAHRATLAALAVLVAAAGPVSAQQGQGMGQMSPEQRAQRMADRFKAADTNHDGKLSLDEAKTGMPMLARNFDQIDTAHTGSVTMDQITAYMQAHPRPERH